MSATPLPANVLRWLAAALVAAALPHAGYLPLWVSALVPAALALRLGLGRPPGRWLLVPLVLVTFAAVLAHFRTIAGTEAGGAFFTAMVALKFLESRDRRDAALLVCLAYFLATSIFLSDQSIGMAAYVIGVLVLITVALITLAAPDGPPVGLRVRRAAVLLLQAVPIMLVLFLLFPRLPGPLWGVGDEETGRTGLDDRMTPGSITRVVESPGVALRAKFDDAPPPPSRRYWRGPVLWDYDGRTWSAGDPASRSLSAPANVGRTLGYTVTIEPHGRRWVFALDLPLAPDDDGLGRTPGHNLVADDPLKSTRQYTLRSALDYRLQPELPPWRRERALALPDDAAPQARALAREWRREADGPDAIVERALTWLREREFVYTLSPPALAGDPVDDFLFNTRAGFCEHYASAFVVLMRAAGIPARVVTGYLGGESNELGDYLIVRQSDAHAWAEVWLPATGWTRVDATSVVSSERLRMGIGSVAGADERLGLMARGGGWIRSLGMAWDSANYTWNRLVLGYGPRMQQRLLDIVGLGGIGRYALGMVTVAAAALALVGVWLLALRARPPDDPVARAWARALSRLGRAGIVADPAEGPRDLAARVARVRPDLAAPFGRIARLYVALRFRPVAPPGAATRLQREVAAFRPQHGPGGGPRGDRSASPG